MLTEQFVSSIGTLRKAPSTAVAKDAAIFVQELHPLPAQRAVFKKSATPPNCLAVSESHIFAAQVDKAVVHMYSREKGNQEVTIPFPERITCIALACQDMVLALGTEKGRIFLWETHTGRQVATTQAHLQTVTALAVDQASNVVLSGSADASVHVWSLPGLLSFSSPTNTSEQSLNAPLRTLSGHRDAVTALVVGHSASFCNIAISASRDNTCIVWDYHSNALLRTVLLPSSPLCLVLDPADRAFYTGYEDGSVQMIDFYSESIVTDEKSHPLYNKNRAAMPMQPALQSRWETSQDDPLESALSMILTYDGSRLITGHESGKIVTWDIPMGRFSNVITPVPLPGPVTNLHTLPVAGFPVHRMPRLKLHTVLKPRYGDFDMGTNTDGKVPAKYTVSAQLASNIATPVLSATGLERTDVVSDFEAALIHPAFPPNLLAASIAELIAWKQPSSNGSRQSDAVAVEPEADFMALDSPLAGETQQLEQQNIQLKAELAALRRVQKASFVQMEALRREKQARMPKTNANGQGNMDEDMKDLEEAEKGWSELGRKKG